MLLLQIHTSSDIWPSFIVWKSLSLLICHHSAFDVHCFTIAYSHLHSFMSRVQFSSIFYCHSYFLLDCIPLTTCLNQCSTANLLLSFSLYTKSNESELLFKYSSFMLFLSLKYKVLHIFKSLSISLIKFLSIFYGICIK